MTLHTALTIPEIVTAILRTMTQEGFYSLSDNLKNARPDLLSIALSCTELKDPSLDVLWHTMDTIIPLLKLIPEMQVLRKQLVVLGDIDPSQLEVFYSYARRIKHCDVSDISCIDPSTCAQLSQLEHGLLPSLTSIDVGNSGHLILLPVLLPALVVKSRAVFSVTWHAADRLASLDGFMLALVKHVNTQALQHLALSGTLHREFTSTFPRLIHLQSVELWLSTESWTFEIIEGLSSLRLTYLHLDFESADLAPVELLGPNAFPVLTSLSLTGRGSLILYILNAITGNYLASIVIYETGMITPTGAEKHYCLYKNYGRFTSLREIKHSVECTFTPSNGRRNMTSVSVIQPLLALRHLNVLEIQFPQPWYQISDQDISDLAFACPALKELRIYPITPPRRWSMTLPTSKSLASLARRCPNLIELDIPIINMDILSSDLPPISCHGLQTLRIYNLTVNSPLLTARLLDRLFPHLKTLYLSDDPDEKVGKLVFELCQPARSDERLRLSEGTGIDLTGMKCLV